MEEFIKQLQRILSDQRRELEDIRKTRKELGERLAEKDAEEIEVLVGIKQTVETLEKLGVYTD